MFRKLSFFVGLSLLMLSLNACFENPSFLYEGATVVEFKNQRNGFATQPVNNVSNAVRARTVRQGIGRDSILIQLVGPQRATATAVAYTVNPTSTAVEGTHYAIIGTKGSLTIPANSSTGYLVFQFLPGIAATAPATQTVTISLTLAGSEEIKPSENYKNFTYTVRN